MAKVTFILGLSGSGKTHLAEELLKNSEAMLFDEGFHDNFTENFETLIEYLNEGIDFIIIAMEYRTLHNQKVIQQMLEEAIPGITVEWYYLENDVEKAKLNLARRKNKVDAEGHIEINSRITKDYEIPEGADVLPIVTDW